MGSLQLSDAPGRWSGGAVLLANGLPDLSEECGSKNGGGGAQHGTLAHGEVSILTPAVALKL